MFVFHDETQIYLSQVIVSAITTIFIIFVNYALVSITFTPAFVTHDQPHPAVVLVPLWNAGSKLIF